MENQKPKWRTKIENQNQNREPKTKIENYKPKLENQKPKWRTKIIMENQKNKMEKKRTKVTKRDDCKLTARRNVT